MPPAQVALLALCDHKKGLPQTMVTEGKGWVAKTLMSSLRPQSPWKWLAVQKICVCVAAPGLSGYMCLQTWHPGLTASLGSQHTAVERLMEPERFTGLWKYVSISRGNKAWELGDLSRSPKLDPRAQRALEGMRSHSKRL